MLSVGPRRAAGGAHLRFQFIELVLKLLAGMLRGAAHQQASGRFARRWLLPVTLVCIAEVEHQASR